MLATLVDDMWRLLPRCKRKLNKSVWVVTGKQRNIAETSGRIDLGPAGIWPQVHLHQKPSLIRRHLQNQFTSSGISYDHITLGEMYIGHSHLCVCVSVYVCLFVCPLPHSHTTAWTWM